MDEGGRVVRKGLGEGFRGRIRGKGEGWNARGKVVVEFKRGRGRGGRVA